MAAVKSVLSQQGLWDATTAQQEYPSETAIHFPRAFCRAGSCCIKASNAIFKIRSLSHISSASSICSYGDVCSLSRCEPVHTCTGRRQRTWRNVTSHLPRVERGGHAVVWSTCCYDNDSSADCIPAWFMLRPVLALSGNSRCLHKSFRQIVVLSSITLYCIFKCICYRDYVMRNELIYLNPLKTNIQYWQNRPKDKQKDASTCIANLDKVLRQQLPCIRWHNGLVGFEPRL